MERQSSFGSQGSGKSSATKIVKDAQKHGESVENQNANNGFTTALFGVLFTLAKEKYSDSWKVAVLTVIVDFLLIMAIMFNLEYPWAVDPHTGVFRFFYMLEIHKPLAATGYKFYVITFYLLSAMLFLSVAICVWVAWCFKNDSFPFLWPIKFVRIVASLFFGMLYIAALNIFLVILECAPEHGVWVQHIWHVECLAMPHLIHLVVATLSSLTFAVAALLLVIADHELQPMSRSLLAAPHSMCELKAQLAKTVITVVDVLLWDFPRVQGVVFAVCTTATFYFHLKQLPYYTSWINSFRLSFFAVHAWVGVHLGVLVFLVEAHKVKKGSMGFIQWDIVNYETAQTITNSMLYGLPAVFFGAGLLGAIRLYYFFRISLRFQILHQQPNLYSKRVYRFSDDKDVEICSRVARVWDEDGNLDQQTIDLAETILRAGIQQFPKSPYLHIVYANLLIDCRQQLQSGWSQLEEARRMPLNLSYRFSIFTREQEHKQKAAVSSSGESAADLVSYVEFQRNYRMIQSYHKAALVAMREFWRLLLYDAVNMNSLTSAFRKIEQMERLADKTYKTVLERYPKAVKLLRSYAIFLETVKNDPWTAAQFYSEAEKQEEALENAEHDLAGDEGLSMRNSAIITINAMGIIQMANKHATKMLGYNKGELEGKNISCLMPQPFSARHNTYMRNYVTTGKAKILDSLREVVALHRDRYVFPIKILVTKSQGNGADAIFMGLLKEVDVDPHQIKAWLMPTGVTLCADMSFTDYAGWAPNDLIGKPFTAIAADPVGVDKLLEHALKATEEELAEGSIQADVLLLHKYAEDVPVTVRLEMGGTADQRLLVLNMTRCGEVVPTMVFDHHGRVLFANQALCSLLGTKPKDMRGRDIGTLLPQPFGFLHHRWIKDAETSLNKPPPSSCRAGAVHSLVSSNGVHVPVRMSITSREISGVHVNIVRANRVTNEEALDEQRLSITTDQHGHILSVSTTHHQVHGSVSGLMPGMSPGEPIAGNPRPQIFGFPPENLMGRKLYDAVDIFQEWHAEGHSVMHAVKALAQHSTTRPGSAWRVGVLPQYLSVETEKAAHKLGRQHGEAEPQEEGAPPVRQLSHRRSMKRSSTLLRSSMIQWRAAVMQVLGPEHTPAGTHYTIKLWRPELLSGVMELNDKLMVIKADPAAGLIFGVPANTMSQQPLSRFLKLGPPGSTSTRLGLPGLPGTRASTAANSAAGGQPPLLTKESLLGNKHVKGGMKGKMAHKSGPRRVFEARHADGMPLQISFQVALKNGTSNTRMMAAIKPLNLIKGNVAVLHTAMHGEDLDHFTVEENGTSIRRLRTHTSQHALAIAAGKDPGAASGVKRQATSKLGGASQLGMVPLLGKAPSGLSGGAIGVAPGMSSARTLDTGGVGGSGAAHSEGVVHAGQVKIAGVDGTPDAADGDPLATHRTDASGLATARNVELEVAATPRPDGVTGDKEEEEPRPGSSRRPLSSAMKKRRSGSLARSVSGPNRPPISDDSAMARSPQERSRQEREQEEEEERRQRHHHHTYGRHLTRKSTTRQWDHVLHVDPEEVPIPHDVEYDIEHHVGDEKEMGISSSSSEDSDGSGSEESDQHVGQNTEGAADKMTREEAFQRKKTMALLEPSERVQYVKGVRRVKEWLASNYYFDRRDADPVDSEVHHALAVAVPDPRRHGAARQLSRVDEESPLPHSHKAHGVAAVIEDDGLNPDDQLMTLDELAAEVDEQENGEDDNAEGAELEGELVPDTEGDPAAAGRHGAKGAWSEEGGGGATAAAGGGTVHHQGGIGKGDASSVGEPGAADSNGMSRGRRLKRLLKLLSGQKVSRGVSRLRMHVLIVIGCMMLVHAVCFMLLIIFINKQKQFITEISAAGEAIDRTHFTAMYTRAIEAATRGAGFASSDIPALEARLTTDVDRLEYLHQGLYLGFKNLRRSTSDKLNDLWDLKQWNVTQYKDTKVPTYESLFVTLWNLGNDFVSAVREVAFYAAANKLLLQDSSFDALSAYDNTTTAPPMAPSTAGITGTNVTLPLNRFWLFVRANAGESLYVGYLRVLNTLLLLAQDNISNLKVILIALLLVEGCLVCFAAIGYIFWLLWKATRGRAALFTVFLVIPQGQLKALASRHITTNQGDDDSDDDGGGKQDSGDRGGGGADDGASDGASVVSGAPGGPRRSFTGMAPDKSGYSNAASTPGRKGITFNEHTVTKHGHSETVMGRIKRAMSGEMAIPASDAAGHVRRFYTRKRLTHTTSDIKHLAWPFFAWGVLIVIIYLVSYLQFAAVEESLVNLKMLERSTAQASRAMYYINELALETDQTLQANLQPIVREEATWLDTVYSTTLYGGRTLEDGLRDGAHDVNGGSLFAKEHHASLLFESKGCFRDSVSSCLSESDRFYQVSRNAIDPMMRRLMQEAHLLSLDDLADVNYTSSRWQYMWQVAREDLHEGLVELVSSYQSDALGAFTAQGTLHTVVFAISWVLWLLYLLLLLKPYLQISSTETKRVAEMLSQLPPELDVEGMVEESWLVVADTQLDRSHMSAWEPKTHRSVANLAFNVFAAVRLASHVAAKKFSNDKDGEPGGTDQEDDNGSPGDPVGKGRMGSLGSDGGQSLFSEKLKAALKVAKGMDDDGPDKGPMMGAGGKWKGDLDEDEATVVSEMDGSRYGPSADGKGAQKDRQRGNSKVSPTDSAQAMNRPGSGSVMGSRVQSITDGRAPANRRISGDNGSGRPSNRVVPVNGPSEPEGDDADDRPLSPLLDFMTLAPAAADDGTASPAKTPRLGPKSSPGGAAPNNRPPSPYHFNKVMSLRNNNTRHWTDDDVWQAPAALRTAMMSADNARGNGAPEFSRGGGSGDIAMASPLVAAVAGAAGADYSDQALLPGEIDDPDIMAARSGSLASSRVGSIHKLPLTPGLLVEAAPTLSPRDRLVASASRVTSPRVPSSPLGGLDVTDRRRSLDRGSGSQPMSPAAPPSRLGTPTAAAAGTATIVAGRFSIDRPASRMAGLAPTAANIDLPPPPAFNRSPSTQGAASPLSKVPSKDSAETHPTAGGGGEAASNESPATALRPVSGSGKAPAAGAKTEPAEQPVESIKPPPPPAQPEKPAPVDSIKPPSPPAQPEKLAPVGNVKPPPPPAQPEKLAPVESVKPPPPPAQPEKPAPVGNVKPPPPPAQPEKPAPVGNVKPPPPPAQPEKPAPVESVKPSPPPAEPEKPAPVESAKPPPPPTQPEKPAQVGSAKPPPPPAQPEKPAPVS